MAFTVLIENAGEDGWGAYVPDLPGCTAGGHTFEEVVQSVQTSTELWLQHAHEVGDQIPVPSTQALSMSVAAWLLSFGMCNKPFQIGPGLDESWRSRTFQRRTPECHEHCGSCMSVGCPCPEHKAEWISGFLCVSPVDHELWLCPKCFERYRVQLDLKLESAS